jgi:hypothetical protein
MTVESKHSNWEKLWKNDFLEIFHNDELEMGLCVASQEYYNTSIIQTDIS